MLQNNVVTEITKSINEEEQKEIKINSSEMDALGLSEFSSSQKEELSEFVYNLSLVLYKSHQNGKS